MGRRPGPNGARYRAARKAVLEHSTICWLCGHDGADQTDHVQPRSLSQGRDDADLSNLRSAHGVKGCPTCGLKCNQSRGNRPVVRPTRSRDW